MRRALPSRRTRGSALALLVASTVAASCVPLLDEAQKPCPCADGKLCCPTSGSCLDADEKCPDRYPASSTKACATDADCPRGEACHSWRLPAAAGDGDTLTGPQRCRRLCEPGYACASGESCQLALRDGRPLAEGNTGALCLDEAITPDGGADGAAADAGDGGADGGDAAPLDGGGTDARDASGDTLPECAAIGCAGCPPDKIGRTYCADKTTVKVCYSALHPRCGVVCSQLTWSCDLCDDSQGAVLCYQGSGPIAPGICAASDCASCPASGSELYCDGSTLKTCLRGSVDINEESCPEACAVIPLETCPAGCGAGPQGPQCQ